MNAPRGHAAILCVCLMAIAPAAAPARPDERQTVPAFMPRLDWQMRLSEVDKLLALGNVARAEQLLKGLEAGPAPRRELATRWLAVAQRRGDHATAVTLCREILAGQPRNPRFLRELARSSMALGDLPAARAAVDSFVAVSPDPHSGALIATDLWQRAGRHEEALALIDAQRRARADPRVYARQRGASLIALERLAEGAAELVAEGAANLVNLPLLRAELLEMSGDAATAGRLARCFAVHANDVGDGGTAAAVLAASLELRAARAAEALAVVEPLHGERNRAAILLQLASVLVREAPLGEDRPARTATTEFLLTALERLGASGVLDSGFRIRALDLLAQTAEDALRDGVLAAAPEEAERRLARVLDLVRQGSPGSAHLYAAQILLAHHTRDVLRRPAEAAARLERLLTDLDLPLEGVTLARLALGECYLAAGDTARGRLVLTRLARGAPGPHRAAAGQANWALARLDLAQGHFATARDRLAAVALDNPLADYANDALELGLVVAEELESAARGQERLALYAQSVRHQLGAAADSQLVALERFVAAVGADTAQARPPHLLERGRLELARLYRDRGDPQGALAQCDRIILDHPDGRHPADAMALKGEIALAGGNPAAAREAWERLLLQYPDWLFADDVRDRMRSLP